MDLTIQVAIAILAATSLQPPAYVGVARDPAVERPVCGANRSVAPAVSTTTARDAARVVRNFVRAYNDGDLARLDSIFSSEPDFEWYFVSRGARREFTAYDRAELPPYFARRFVAGDHLKLLSLDVSEDRGWHGGFDFSFRLVRTSDERGAEGRYHGKGAAGCTIFVWSMGREK